MSDDAKKLILARRARFVAATLAGVGVACGKEPTPPPQPCLSQPMTHLDAAPPEPCLSPMPPPLDAGAVAPEAADAGRPSEPDAGSKPMPCLAPPLATTPTGPVPRPCLTPVRPKDKTQR